MYHINDIKRLPYSQLSFEEYHAIANLDEEQFLQLGKTVNDELTNTFSHWT